MKLITAEKDLEEVVHWMTRAAGVAPYSNCTKSQRGVVIVRDNLILSLGYLWHTSPEEYCNPCVRAEINDNSRRDICGAEHAEQMALRLANEKQISLHGSRLYHIKVKDGQMVQSGQPSCEICSASILENGISEVVLWHKQGHTVYDAKEFDDLSREYAEK